ncbi:hypothetical protein [Arsenicicoccus dermatophilus]|uniref:hypothetical protein n=1 Tax=Arsenicicoccus dermatophilus TaxID=1076331 RepID=UPI00391765E8
MSEQVPSLSVPTRLALARRHLMMAPILVLLVANAVHRARDQGDLLWWSTAAVLLATLSASWWVWWREVRQVRAGAEPWSTIVPQSALLLVLLVAATTGWAGALVKDFGPAGLVAGLVALGATAALAWDQRAAARRYAGETTPR